MPVFEKRSRIAAPPERVFAFHEAPDALERLTPPWENMRIVEKTGGLAAGARVVLEMRLGPLKLRWVAEHTLYEPGTMFQDVQRRGPFKKWVHTHRMEPDGAGGCILTDHVDYELPLGALGELGGAALVRQKLEKTFAYRHEVTRRACEPSA